MRWKMIVANAGIILVIGLLSFALMRDALSGVLTNPAGARTTVAQAVRAANARLALDALQVERWLSERVRNDAIRDVFSGGTAQARQEAAMAQANRVREDAAQAPNVAGLDLSLVVLINRQGVVLGRNGSALMRGERLVDTYPALKRVLEEGITYSDVWINAQRQEQLLVSVAPIRGEANAIIGAVVAGAPLSDDRLQRASDLTSGKVLMFGVATSSGADIVARSGTSAPATLSKELGPQILQTAIRSGDAVVGDAVGATWVYAVTPVDGYRSDRAVLVAAMSTAQGPELSGLLMPIFGATVLGILLTTIFGFLMGNYLSRPISELEDGLLSIINGNQSLRFQIEHDEYGGLVFRINSLLNALMGVPEETTDEAGRPSVPPAGRHFAEALSVDESMVAGQAVNPQVAAALASESVEAYQRRVYGEYVDCRRRIGDPVDGIEFGAFCAKLESSEQEMGSKHGRAVRFMVELRDQRVVLVAVPLG